MQGLRPKYYVAYILVEYFQPKYKTIEYKLKSESYTKLQNILLDFTNNLLTDKSVHIIDSYISELF